MTKANEDGPTTGGEPNATAALKADEVKTAAASSSAGDIHTYIGARLRKAFDDIASQPVPDRFLQLMQDLDRA